jgi:hypothetical protein
VLLVSTDAEKCTLESDIPAPTSATQFAVILEEGGNIAAAEVFSRMMKHNGS